MKFETHHRYRMPVFFGPAPGPRQIPFNHADPARSPRRLMLSLACKVSRAAIEPLLPSGFTLWGEPRIIIEIQTLSEVDWLAGRGYNTFGVKIPVLYAGKDRQIQGHLLTVLWENQADPIITGREELGFSKVFCDIPDIQADSEHVTIGCSWFGFEFFRLTGTCPISDMPIEPAVSGDEAAEGVFHFKYIPRTNVLGEADVAEVSFTPAANPNAQLISRRTGVGQCEFFKGSWEDLPTLHHIVNFFASLELTEFSAMVLTETRGGKDLGDTVHLA